VNQKAVILFLTVIFLLAAYVLVSNPQHMEKSKASSKPYYEHITIFDMPNETDGKVRITTGNITIEESHWNYSRRNLSLENCHLCKHRS